MNARALPRPCGCCGREFTVRDVATKAGVSVQSVKAYLSGDLLWGDSPTDRHSRLIEKIITAIEDLGR